jgi:hypothetical protein
MGLLDGNTQQAYYTGTSFGGYQFVSINDIINNFIFSNTGEDTLIPKIKKSVVQYHALRSLQELSYDTFKSLKSMEITLPPSLQMLLPQDYVNYTSLTFMGKDGLERVIYPTRKTSNPLNPDQNADGTLDTSSADLSYTDSTTWTTHKNTTSTDPDLTNYVDGSAVYPTYYIDNNTGKIHFSSNMAGRTITLKYISDGVGKDEEMIVHKFAEEAMYKCISLAILSSRADVPEYIISRIKRERFSAVRSAKLRLSNLKVNEMTDAMRGAGKHLKG